jgi:predicted Zn-ribbon and HTH transcriptional regulator
MIDIEQKEKIANELNRRLKKPLTCPMCQNNSFTMASGYFHNSLQNNLVNLNIGSPSLPTIAIICEKCGFVSQHALGILGLLPETKNEKNDESNS